MPSKRRRLRRIAIPVASSPESSSPTTETDIRNLYVHLDNAVAQAGGNFQPPKVSLISLPGTETVAQLDGSGQIRAIERYQDDRFIVITSTSGYIFNSDFSFTKIFVGDFNNNVSVATDGLNIVVASNGSAVTWNGTDHTIEKVVLPQGDMGEITFVVNIRAWFIFTTPTNLFVMRSATLDFRADDYANAANYPDNMSAAVEWSGRLIIFGTRTIEGWTPNLEEGFPYINSQDMVYRVGCLAPRSIVRTNSRLIWLGNDKRVYTLPDPSLKPISTQAVVEHISDYDIRNATAYTFVERNHEFYVLCLQDSTWVLNITTGLWSRWVYSNEQKHHVSCGARGIQTLVGHGSKPTVMRLSHQLDDDDGVESIRTIVTDALFYRQEQMRLWEVRLQVSTGYTRGDMRVGLQESDDNARTWKDETSRVYAKRGQYDQQVVFRNRGMTRGRVMRFRIYGGGRCTIGGLYAHYSL